MTREQAIKAGRLGRPDTYALDRLNIKLHPKHTQVLVDLFGRRGSRVACRCANEIGKTRSIATVAILYALEILNAQVISTAGVWMQVAQQLIPSLKGFAKLYPDWRFLDASIKIAGVDRYVGFSTRDEGFAQGFHRHPNMPLLGIVDEAAAVADSVINGVEDRCNPDFFLIMGSPLDPNGMFYRIETDLSKHYTHHHISQYDCMTKDGYWIEPETIERKIAKWGKDSQFVQSNIFGEFGDMAEGAMLSLTEYDKCLNNPPDWVVNPNQRHAFMDFAAGRNKNVLAVRYGNKVWVEKKWTDKDTMSACGEFLALFKKLQREIGLMPEEVDGDADGLGLVMIQRLEEMGLPVGHFHGGSKPRMEKEYFNEVSEAWGEGAGQIKRMEVIIPSDLDFKAQCLSRKLKRNSSGLFQLESKEDMVKRGLESPDEADALFGCMMPSKVRSGRTVMGIEPEQPHNRHTIWQKRDFDEKQEEVLPGTHFG